MEGTSRPVWGCLDAQEIRLAAAGHGGDPAIHEHLARCGQCRQVVQDLGGDVRRSRRTGGVAHRRSLLARPGLWFLLVLGVIAYVLWQRFPRKATPPERATVSAPAPVAAPAPQPVAAPESRPPARSISRRPRPRPSGGSPDNAAIVAVIRNNQTGVRMCYERALKRNPRLAVRLEVQVSVSSAGVPERVSLGGLSEGALGECIRNVIKTWPFPRHPGPYETEFPLRLEQGY
jgi:hypothetical protein